MYNFVTRDYINEINNFLEGKTSSMSFPQINFADPQRVLSLFGDGNYNQNEISRLIVSYSMNLLSDGDNGDKLNEYYNQFRDFGSKVLYVYNHNASMKWLFYIGNFGTMNDNLETQWFKEYVSSVGKKIDPYVKKAINLRDKGNILLKCSTTSVVNEAYMFANYTFSKGDYCTPSDWKQKRVAFNKEKANDLFDNIYANSKYIPLRGFVRYDGRGKKESIIWLSKLSKIGSSFTFIKQAVEFACIVLSYFVKGACMSVEGEYRHIVINEAKLSSLTLNTIAESIAIGTYPDTVLKSLINGQYQKDCTAYFSCDSTPQGWNEYYEQSI